MYEIDAVRIVPVCIRNKCECVWELILGYVFRGIGDCVMWLRGWVRRVGGDGGEKNVVLGSVV